MARDPIHPGETLREDLDALGMSAAELARKIEVPVNRITEILNGRRAVTGDTALRLGRFFGTSGEFWLNLQKLYELRRAERDNGKDIARLADNFQSRGRGFARRCRARRGSKHTGRRGSAGAGQLHLRQGNRPDVGERLGAEALFVLPRDAARRAAGGRGRVREEPRPQGEREARANPEGPGLAGTIQRRNRGMAGSRRRSHRRSREGACRGRRPWGGSPFGIRR